MALFKRLINSGVIRLASVVLFSLAFSEKHFLLNVPVCRDFSVYFTVNRLNNIVHCTADFFKVPLKKFN